MNLEILLWMGGVLFSLGIFAIKVGLGLGFKNIRWREILIILSLYLLLFILISFLSERLMEIIEPLLRKGPFLHLFMALGLVAWGVFLLTRKDSSKSTLCTAYPLLLPCPVCLTAITFSIWAAGSVIKVSEIFLGLGLGVVFIALTLFVIIITRLRGASNPEINLGLAMLTVGLYFILSLFIPGKIEEAKAVYRSFLTETGEINLDNSAGVILVLLIGILLGFLFKPLTKSIKGNRV